MGAERKGREASRRDAAIGVFSLRAQFGVMVVLSLLAMGTYSVPAPGMPLEDWHLWAFAYSLLLLILCAKAALGCTDELSARVQKFIYAASAVLLLAAVVGGAVPDRSGCASEATTLSPADRG